SRRRSIPKDRMKDLRIPLPSIDGQHELVTEIDSYREIVGMAQKMSQVKGMNIVVKPSWPRTSLGELAKLEYGYTASAKENGDARFIRITDIDDMGSLRANGKKY